MLDHHRILARVRNVSEIFHKCLQMFTNLRQQIQVVCLMHLEYLQLLVALLVVVQLKFHIQQLLLDRGHTLQTGN
jgi:hypothetical protein